MTLSIIAALFLTAAPSAPAAKDPFADFKPLLGKWIGGSEEQKDAGTGWFTFEEKLDRRVLVRTNHAEYPPRPDRPRTHDDLMVIAPENGRLTATYWDTEGHVIHYAVTTSPSKIVFESVPAPGPRFRFTFSLDAAHPAQVSMLFEIAPPNAPDSFQPYIRATAHR